MFASTGLLHAECLFAVALTHRLIQSKNMRLPFFCTVFTIFSKNFINPEFNNGKIIFKDEMYVCRSSLHSSPENINYLF
jgi:hypothetical protein